MITTNRRLIFAKEYLKDFKPSAAAVRAGYSEDEATHMGQILLQGQDVQRQLEELTEGKNKDKSIEITIRFFSDE